VWKAPVKGVMIDAAQIAVGFTKFERGFTFRTPEQSTEWLHDAEYHIKRTWEAAEQGWPMNDTACMNYGGCPYIDVCSKSPQVRMISLRAADLRNETTTHWRCGDEFLNCTKFVTLKETDFAVGSAIDDVIKQSSWLCENYKNIS
jgi:hypothetical protein